jgi:outer membrane lipoprotein SlyB
MSFTFLIRLLCAALVFQLSSCVPATQTGSSYSRREARVLQQVKIGKVLEVAEVFIEGTKSGAGGLVGGAVGAIAGRNTGSGAGGKIASVLGGAVGSVVGAKIEEARTRSRGHEYTIRLDKGELISVVQAIDPKAVQIVVGDEVKLLSQGDTYRVTRLNTVVRP